MSGIRTAAGLKAIARISIRNSANALKVAAGAHLRDTTNALRDLASVGGMIASATPDSAVGYGNSHGYITISTNSVTVSVAGGAAPYAFAWAMDTADMAPINPTGGTTAFRTASTVGPGDSVTDIATCTVTDAHGNTTTCTVATNATNLGS